ncbi:hypothetical protein [Actinobacillus capsulatus]|uniref:hypothetical protein n=1 Tax=Actinobacillus capsulatus TaxID=717 RepID=UPI0003759F12
MLAILSFLGSGYVSLGYITYLKVVSGIPAGIWAGANVTWGQFFFNMIPVFLGNVTGEAAFVGASYLFAYKHLLKDDYSI